MFAGRKKKKSRARGRRFRGNARAFALAVPFSEIYAPRAMADFHFFRRGGSDQLRIEKPEDLNAVGALDQKLWVALSMPVSGQELDERTLALLDADADGRVRVPEILAAVKFMRENTADFSAFFAGKDEIALSAVAPDRGSENPTRIDSPSRTLKPRRRLSTPSRSTATASSFPRARETTPRSPASSATPSPRTAAATTLPAKKA